MRKKSKIIGMQTQNYEKKSQISGCKLRLNEEEVKIIGMQTQTYEKKVKISGCNLRIMRKKSKYRDANSDL